MNEWFMMIFNGMIGTKWCGPGNISTSEKEEDEFGSSKDTDECCKQHDLSSDSIVAKGKRGNLLNPMPYTMYDIYI